MTALLLLALTLAQPPQASGAAGDAPGTGQIRGRVTDKETGRPIAGAIVNVSRMNEGPAVSALTREDGTYELTGLRAGTCFLRAGPPGRSVTHLMQLFGQTGDGGAPIVLKDGEVRNDVNFALPRALAMTVRVVDEWGEPLWGLAIKLRNAQSGAEHHGTLSEHATDDRGMVRVFSLEAGRYTACAEDPYFSATSTEASTRERFVRTCYPSAAAEAGAEPIALAPGEPVEIQIRMLRNRTFTIAGTVLDASGAPAAAHVSLVSSTPTGSSSMGVMVGADGRFTVRNVPAGPYALEARLGGPERPQDRRDLEAAYMPVTVGSADVEGLVLTMTRAVEIEGRITTDDPSRPLPKGEGPGIMVLSQYAGSTTFDMGSLRMSLLQDDQSFVLSGMFGPRRVAIANTPKGWYVKSMQYRGKDVADGPFEVTSGREPGTLEVVMSTRGATLIGRVTDDAGNPVKAGMVVVVFPVDPARRSMFDLDDGRVSADGTYRVGPLRRGDYFVTAIESVGFGNPGDGDLLSRLAEGAERVTLGADEERTIDLRIVKIR
jgi:carboxypeptidase family protein